MVRDLVGFLWARRQWWLLPAIVATLVVAGALLLGSSPASPFLYTFF